MEKNPCLSCDYWDEERGGCSCSPLDRSYACPLEDGKETEEEPVRYYKVRHSYYLVGLYPLHDGVSIDAVLVPVDREDGRPYVMRTLSPDDLRRVFSPLGGIRSVMENFYPDGHFGMRVMF